MVYIDRSNGEPPGPAKKFLNGVIKVGKIVVSSLRDFGILAGEKIKELREPKQPNEDDLFFNPEDARVRYLLERWCLRLSDLQELYIKFGQMDEDGSGTIDFDEFFAWVKEAQTEFLELIFSIIVPQDDASTEKELDFVQWVNATLTFCFATERELVEQVFYLHDKDRNGFLDLTEVHSMFQNLHSENRIFSREVVSSMVEKYLLDDGKLDYDEFREACSSYPILLWPMFRVQHRMRKAMLGMDLFKQIDQKLKDIYFLTPRENSNWSLRRTLREKQGLVFEDEYGFNVALPEEKEAWTGVDDAKEFINVFCCAICGCIDTEDVSLTEMKAWEDDMGEEDAAKIFNEYRKMRKGRKKQGLPEMPIQAREMASQRIVMRTRRRRRRRKLNKLYKTEVAFDSDWYDYSDEHTEQELGEREDDPFDDSTKYQLKHQVDNL